MSWDDQMTTLLATIWLIGATYGAYQFLTPSSPY